MSCLEAQQKYSQYLLFKSEVYTMEYLVSTLIYKHSSWLGLENTCLSSMYKYLCSQAGLKFMFSKKATKIDKIFTIDLTVCSKCQINGEDLVKFCVLLRKHEL